MTGHVAILVRHRLFCRSSLWLTLRNKLRAGSGRGRSAPVSLLKPADTPGPPRSSGGDNRRGVAVGSLVGYAPTAPADLSKAGNPAHSSGIAAGSYRRLSHPSRDDLETAIECRTASWPWLFFFDHKTRGNAVVLSRRQHALRHRGIPGEKASLGYNAFTWRRTSVRPETLDKSKSPVQWAFPHGPGCFYRGLKRRR
jgi:hypothetical protein